MEYLVVQKAQSARTDTIDAWDEPAWQDVQSIRLADFMGNRPTHFPLVQAKMVYDAESVSITFFVRDQFVLAQAQSDQDPVCTDSCVEFFFSPCESVDAGYFNLEMNCGGTVLFYYFRKPRTDWTAVSGEHLAMINRRCSMPKIVTPERSEPTDWSVSYRLPISILQHYFPRTISPPQAGAIWRANFYKCADNSSHPHWLTWSPVNNETPDFHRPVDFGTLRFA